MNSYIPNTESEKIEMLEAIGVREMSELFSDIPSALKLNRRLDLDSPKSELEITSHINELAKKNKSSNELACFLGAGAYDHYIPSIVKHLVSRSEFYTAYTPYQPEISQGTLQGIFEYQSMITALTGMEISNASMYDGASSLAEAAIMAVETTKRKKVLVSKGVHPQSREVLKTYLKNRNVSIEEIDLVEGSTAIDNLNSKLDSQSACVIIQNPNFLGVIEDMSEIEETTHKNKSLLVMSVNPISLGLLTPPSEYGADIVTGEGQSLGNDLNFGGPYLGFIAVNSKLMRKMPGRICGYTNDIDGKRAFVLTLQAREQHIRREKATSNICSNQGLNALTASIYLSTIGKEGIKEVATQCAKKAHYAFNQITALENVKALFNKPFFMEFAISIGNTSNCSLNTHLLNNGFIGGYDISKDYPEYKNSQLICVTEKRTREEIDTFVGCMKEGGLS